MKLILKEDHNGRVLPCLYGNECIPDIGKGSMSISFDNKRYLVVDCSLIVQVKDLDLNMVDKFRKQCLFDSRKRRIENFYKPFNKIKNWFKWRLFRMGLYKFI